MNNVGNCGEKMTLAEAQRVIEVHRHPTNPLSPWAVRRFARAGVRAQI